MYRREIIRFKEELERRFETTITEEAIRHEIHLNNEITKSLLRLQYLMANDPAPVSGLNIVNTAYGSGFNMDVESLPPASTIWRTRSRRSTPPARTRARSPVSW